MLSGRKVGGLNGGVVVAREASLFVFILNLWSALCFSLTFLRRCVRASGYEVCLESLSLPLAQAEYGTVEATIAVEILNREAVVLFVREEANHAPSFKRNCSLAQHHWHSTYLPAFLSQGDVLNGTYAHLRGWASTPLKLQRVALNS
jgi:hypothetical protein